MEKVVNRKPRLFWIVSAPPTSSGGQALTDKAENCGESATTATPQTSSSASTAPVGKLAAASG